MDVIFLSGGWRSSLPLRRTYHATRSTCGSGTQCRAADTGVPVPMCGTSSRGTPLIETAFFRFSSPHISRNSEHVRVWHPVSRSRHWCACPHVRHLISRNPAHRGGVLPFLIAARITQFEAHAGLAPSVAQPTLVCLSPCASPHLAELRSSGSRSSLALLRT